MEYILIGIIGTLIWITYEIWRAPLMQETNDGKLVTKRPTKKLKNLFKRK